MSFLVEFVVLISSLRRPARRAIRAGHRTTTDPPPARRAVPGLV